MKVLKFTLMAVSLPALIQSALACQFINEGDLTNNADCPAVFKDIFYNKAKTPDADIIENRVYLRHELDTGKYNTVSRIEQERNDLIRNIDPTKTINYTVDIQHSIMSNLLIYTYSAQGTAEQIKKNLISKLNYVGIPEYIINKERHLYVATPKPAYYGSNEYYSEETAEDENNFYSVRQYKNFLISVYGDKLAIINGKGNLSKFSFSDIEQDLLLEYEAPSIEDDMDSLQSSDLKLQYAASARLATKNHIPAILPVADLARSEHQEERNNFLKILSKFSVSPRLDTLILSLANYTNDPATKLTAIINYSFTKIDGPVLILFKDVIENGNIAQVNSAIKRLIVLKEHRMLLTIHDLLKRTEVAQESKDLIMSALDYIGMVHDIRSVDILNQFINTEMADINKKANEMQQIIKRDQLLKALIKGSYTAFEESKSYITNFDGSMKNYQLELLSIYEQLVKRGSQLRNPIKQFLAEEIASGYHDAEKEIITKMQLIIKL